MKNKQILFGSIIYIMLIGMGYAQSPLFFRGDISPATQNLDQNAASVALPSQNFDAKSDLSVVSDLPNNHLKLSQTDSNALQTTNVRPIYKIAQQPDVQIHSDRLLDNQLEPSESSSHSSKTPIRDSNSKTDHKSAKEFSFFRSLISVLGGLTIVLGIFFVCVILMKMFSPRTIMSIPENVVEIIGQRSLASRTQLYLIRFGSKLCLVAISPNQIASVAEITDSNEMAQMIEECQKTSSMNNKGTIQNFLEKEFWLDLMNSMKNRTKGKNHEK